MKTVTLPVLIAFALSAAPAFAQSSAGSSDSPASCGKFSDQIA